MAFSSASSSSFSAEINVTPLIDVLLVLLIIFMVIVPVMPHGLDGSIPQNHPSTETAQSPTVVRVLASADATLHYRVNEREATFAELAPALRQIFAARQDHTLFVQADSNLTYGQVAAVIGEARTAGAGAIALQRPQAR